MKSTKSTRIDVVETHVTQRAVYRTKLRRVGSTCQIEQFVVCHRRGCERGADAAAILHPEERLPIAPLGPDVALFSTHYVAAIGSSANGERIPAASSRQLEIEPDAEVIQWSPPAMTHLHKAAACTQCVIHGTMQRICGKVEYVQKVALSRTVAAHDHRQRPECDIACGNALVVERHDARDRDRLSDLMSHG